MAQTLSKTQLPPNGQTPSEQEMFQQGLELGREWAQTAIVRVKAWADENPGQLLVVGVAAGFILGKLLFSSRRTAGE